MKTSRTLSLAGVTALLAAGSLLVATQASAATTVDDVTFYGASDFGVESGGYPTGVEWFFGEVTGTEGSHTFTNTGLTLNDPATGDVQIVNQNVTAPATASDLIDLVNEAEIVSQNGDWTFQLMFFANGAPGITTLRPVAPGAFSSSDPWTTSQAFSTYAANATAPLDDFAPALYAGGTPEFLGYGFFVKASDTTTINAIWWGDHGSSFGTIPTRTMTPNPITPEAFSTAGEGLILSGTNWFPGTVAYIEVMDSDGNRVFFDNLNYAVGPDGSITAAIALPTLPAVGTYYVMFDDDSFYYNSGVLDHYIESPGSGDGGGDGGGESGDASGLELAVAEAKPELAETGVDATPYLVGGSLVVLVGGVLLIAHRRTRRRQG